MAISEAYTIEAAVMSSYLAHVGHTYSVDFTDIESGIMILDGSEVNQYEQVVVQMTYKDY
jgi:hypothetical protein